MKMEKEKQLIDANELIILIGERIKDDLIKAWLYGIISDTPTAEESKGYWIGRQLDNFRKYEVKCSECGWTGIENYDSYVDPSDFNYCPNCGAKMDGDGNA
jgi:predicted RNA-binding Zn-ribbon protein involved in translation (DUF1610 family)